MTGAMGPPVPERARTMLARASSAQVVWLDANAEPVRSLCASRLAVVEDLPSRAGRPVMVEVAEAAPLSVRERILSRLRVRGRAVIDPEDATVLNVVSSAVSLEEGGVVVPVDLAELLVVEAGPLGLCGGALLSHLDAVRPDFVARLTSLVESRRRYGLVRVWPLRLDRHGIVLRLEYARSPHDARLPFADPVRTPEEVRAQLHRLVAEAMRRRQGCRSRGLSKG